MIRRFAAALVVTSLCSTTAFAQSAAANHPGSSSSTMLHAAPGLVPLHIDVTEARRVLVRRHDAASEYVCTTPCRVYVRPGPVDLVLVGWTTNQYHWDVPTHGGSVHLLARRPDGRLAPMPGRETAPVIRPLLPSAVQALDVAFRTLAPVARTTSAMLPAARETADARSAAARSEAL